MAITSPEYLDLIDELTKRKNLAVKEATAGAQGEAQRRGLVGQTGTSDVEMSLRGARTAPIEQSYQTTIAQTLQNLADQEASRKYQTSEREASQGYQSGESQKGREWQTGERTGSQQYGTQERIGSQDWQSQQAKANQAWQTGERVGSQQYGTGERLGTQAYQTGERTGTQDWQKLMTENAQKYGTSERLGQNMWEGALNLQNQNYQSKENQKERERLYNTLVSSQDWQSKQNALDRAAQMGLTQLEIQNMQDMADKASKEWWKTALGQLAGGIGGSLPEWWNKGE